MRLSSSPCLFMFLSFLFLPFLLLSLGSCSFPGLFRNASCRLGAPVFGLGKLRVGALGLKRRLLRRSSSSVHL